VQIDDSGGLTKERADPMRDVVDGKLSHAVNHPDLLMHQAMQTSEVGYIPQSLSDCLEASFSFVENGLPKTPLMRVTLAAWQNTQRGMVDGASQTALDLKKTHLDLGGAPMVPDVSRDDLIEGHAATLPRDGTH
jgi:hypothetical protein